VEVCECGHMEVRPRHGVGSNEPYRNNCNDSNNISFDHYERDHSTPRSSPIWRRIKREAQCTLKTFVDILTGRASKFTYVLAPVLFALFWVLICIITGSRSVSLHDRLVQSKREYEAYNIKLEKQTVIHQIELPPEGTIHVVVAMPFLDVNPLAGEKYVQMLEWMLVYSTLPLTFHILTNQDSVSYVRTVMEKVNGSRSGEFTYNIVQLTNVIDQCTHKICPELKARTDFCEILMGKMTPLLFPWLFPHLDHVLFIDRKMLVQGNIVELSHDLNLLRGSSSAAIAMAPEQTTKYRRGFAGWQSVNPKTKLGRPPPDGKPGYNADLILMNLAKLRNSSKYKSYLSEKKLNSLIKTYRYHSSEDVPDLGDVLNILAAADSAEAADKSLFQSLSCRWSRNPNKNKENEGFNVCDDKGPIMAWTGQPDPGDARRRR